MTNSNSNLEKQRPAGPIGSRRFIRFHRRNTSVWLKIAFAPVVIFSSIAAIALLVTFTAAVTKSDVNLSSIVEAFTEAPTLEVISGRVVNVVDGDTLTIRIEGDEYRIRLHGIDTPEKGQPWGSQAKWALSRKASRQNITVEVITTDRYGRLAGKVWLDSRDINREMVREGHAWAYRQYLGDRSLIREESIAKAAGVGLWSKSNPVPPWEWRRK